jgi:hypothetical protein
LCGPTWGFCWLVVLLEETSFAFLLSLMVGIPPIFMSLPSAKARRYEEDWMCLDQGVLVHARPSPYPGPGFDPVGTR